MTGILLFSLVSHCIAGSELHYRQLIEHSLNKQPLCLGEKRWPVSIQIGSDQWTNAKMEALVDAGLINSREKSGRKTWMLTQYGQASLSKEHDFCYGVMRVRTLQDIQTDRTGVTHVTFTYFIQGIPAWAKNASVRVANTDLDNLVTGIDSVRYEARFTHEPRGTTRLLAEPEQMDLYY
ncbi:CpmK protein [Klebsiella pneumoniae]|jgi:hypothetical protein|uniref:CpmK protein n=1 Tax=Klebsiella pneumoniae complex TaxID=3390273 RepID=UPI001CF68D7E|nr:CpmK protein [Klebsiella pneumoniae]MCF0568716.1 CpmK protein [Klebsiella pneumoniae]MCF0656207.1 CpmK protein [Klebsiella pneumoniae]MCF1175633.1 CpmK protein [Klebsiella pneumoniae]MCQ0804606.1 CpmK protein [Klebsiella pneumoniae]MCQ0850813.1 CpmK protein [Klebsiella pneumoniae]